MNVKTLSITLILSLTILTALPAPFIRQAHAVNQVQNPTTFSPFGPQTETLIFQFYSDFVAMQNAFKAGSVDITDWPAFKADLPIYAANPDILLTSQQSEFGIFDFGINHFAPIFGKAQLQSRPIPVVSHGALTTSAGCSTGFGSLSVTLVNQEAAGALIKDSLNKITITGPQSFTASDSGGATPNGVYNFPCSASQALAGSYVISNSVYANCQPSNQAGCTVTIGSGTVNSVTLNSAFNSPSTQSLTSAGTFVRQAMAHLLNKVQFNLAAPVSGLAACDDIFAPPSQVVKLSTADAKGFGTCNPASTIPPTDPIPPAVLNEECTSGVITLGGNIPSCAPSAAYLLNNQLLSAGSYWWANGAVGATGYASLSDIQAACDYLVAAGFALTAGATCTSVANAAAGTIAPAAGTYPHLITTAQEQTYIRTHAPRKAYGQIIADSLNFLFGTANNGATLGAAGTTVPCAINYGFKSPAPGCTPAYYTISEIANLIFGDGLNPTTASAWGLYTEGYNLGTTPDSQLYGILHSQFGSTICGGIIANFPGDYTFYCDPLYDTYSSAGEFASNFNEAVSAFAQASLRAHRTVANIPVFSRYEQFATLKAWDFASTHSSVVNGLGSGTEAGSNGQFWSLLNARCNTAFTPTLPANRCGGGTPGLLRVSQAQDTDLLSPFQATTVWDFAFIDSVFDSMLTLNPNTGGASGQLIDWMTTFHSATFNPAEVCTVPGGASSIGCTTQIWHLRNDINFHDGSKVTADDIVFSIISMRDVPSAIFQSNVANVASAVAVDSSTVQVKLIHQSPFYEALVGSVPILPKKIWGPLCTGTNGVIGGPGNRCADPTYDPMASGTLVGSGGFVCKDLTTGVIGGSCAQNADGSRAGQAVGLGGRIVLNRNHNYQRCCSDTAGPSSKLYTLSWSDKNRDGVVNILDIADAAFSFGKPDAYWANPLISTSTTVDIVDIATVASEFGQGITSPFLPSQLVGVDPQTNPFFCPTTGC
jgi:hypothetical protein